MDAIARPAEPARIKVRGTENNFMEEGGSSVVFRRAIQPEGMEKALFLLHSKKKPFRLFLFLQGSSRLGPSLPQHIELTV